MLGMATLVSVVLKVVPSVLRDSTRAVSGTQPAPIAPMASPPVVLDSQSAQNVSMDFNTKHIMSVQFTLFSTKKQTNKKQTNKKQQQKKKKQKKNSKSQIFFFGTYLLKNLKVKNHKNRGAQRSVHREGRNAITSRQ